MSSDYLYPQTARGPPHVGDETKQSITLNSGYKKELAGWSGKEDVMADMGICGVFGQFGAVKVKP